MCIWNVNIHADFSTCMCVYVVSCMCMCISSRVRVCVWTLVRVCVCVWTWMCVDIGTCLCVDMVMVSDSLKLLQTMIDQVLQAHPDIRYFHIGADEVGGCN